MPRRSTLAPFLTKYRHLFVALFLTPLFAGIFLSSYWLRFEGQIRPHDKIYLASTLACLLLVKSTTFSWFRIFHGAHRYVTFHDLKVIFQATTASSLLFLATDFLLTPDFTLPRSIVLLDWALTLISISGLRSLKRVFAEYEAKAFTAANEISVLIVGANDSGESLLRTLRLYSKVAYRVVGFIADDASSICERIAGIPVLGTLDETCHLAERHGVQEVLIAAGELEGSQVRRLVEGCQDRDVEVKVLPGIEQLLQESVAIRPRTVSIADLLRREPISLNTGELTDWINDKTLLVTGSAGSIGSEIVRQLMPFSPKRIVLVDRSENGQFFLERELRSIGFHCEVIVCIADVTDRKRMNVIFKTYQPDIVFHAAAYKHVPLMEANPGEGLKNIIMATRDLADLAVQNDVSSFVLISTDKAVNPSSVMGRCKRIAELYIQSLRNNACCRFVTVRFGNVLDSAGSVVPIFREQIEQGGPVTVTHPEMKRYFMTIPEASQLVIQAGAMGRGGEIFVLDMGEPVAIVDLATDMIRLSGLEVGRDIDIRFTGTRPGEKLHEELLLSNEESLHTKHPKILVAKSTESNLKEMQAVIAMLADLTDAPTAIVSAALHDLILSLESPVTGSAVFDDLPANRFSNVLSRLPEEVTTEKFAA